MLPKAAPLQQIPPPKEIEKTSGSWEKSTFGFGDFIDMINPLQHLPVISTIYRKLTSDEIGSAPRMIGGAIFGGLLGSWVSGLASAVANVFSSSVTGKDIGDHVLELAQASTKTHSVVPATPAKHPEVGLTQAATIPPQIHRVDPSIAMQRVQAMSSVREAGAISRPVPVQLSTVTAQSASQGEYGQVQVALEQYRQQMLVDDIKQDIHYWV